MTRAKSLRNTAVGEYWDNHDRILLQLNLKEYERGKHVAASVKQILRIAGVLALMQIVTRNGGTGGGVSAAIKPSLYPCTAVVSAPFICPDKQNTVNYYVVNSYLFSSNNGIRFVIQYYVLFDFRVILRCLSYISRKKRAKVHGSYDVWWP
jgi:hypothetical protein